MSESLEDRLARQREAKKFADERVQKDQELTRAKRESERKFTNPKRHEDAVKRFQELRNPSPAPAKAVSPVIPIAVSGASVYLRTNDWFVNNDIELYSAPEETYRSAYFENGILKWVWATSGYAEAEPDVPAGTLWIESTLLTLMP